MFRFGMIVMVEKGLVGVVLKCWGPHYEVYIRCFNRIQEFDEDEMQHYVHHKELSKDDLEYYE